MEPTLIMGTLPSRVMYESDFNFCVIFQAKFLYGKLLLLAYLRLRIATPATRSLPYTDPHAKGAYLHMRVGSVGQSLFWGTSTDPTASLAALYFWKPFLSTCQVVRVLHRTILPQIPSSRGCWHGQGLCPSD
jgi:hypothetical protein